MNTLQQRHWEVLRSKDAFVKKPWGNRGKTKSMYQGARGRGQATPLAFNVSTPGTIPRLPTETRMKRVVSKQRIAVAELREEDLPFLSELWHKSQVMRYADEFPRLRGWSKSDDLQTAWAKYREKRAALGKRYTQLILRLVGGMRIGESFFMLLPEGYRFGIWEKPEDEVCLMGDIKLKPEYWGQGLGTEGMKMVVEWLFRHTDCCLLVVPPHRKNPAAQRVYEKAGFELYREMRSWRNRKVMELSRERYKRINVNVRGCAN